MNKTVWPHQISTNLIIWFKGISLQQWRALTYCLRIGLFCCCFWSLSQAPGWSESLSNRLEAFPEWSTYPDVEIVQPGEDLIYPEWMAGTWQVTSTLREQVAPLAPDIVTPGFEQNEQFIDQPFRFQVKFSPQENFFIPAFFLPKTVASKKIIVADRQFNGEEIAKAYLDSDTVRTVKVDPNNPNRQITRLSNGQSLVSTVTGRATDSPGDRQFFSSEIMQQQFRGTPQIYLNTVETTTNYHLESAVQVSANQVTAVYLSPTDPNYFPAKKRPVALYRYDLELQKID